MASSANEALREGLKSKGRKNDDEAWASHCDSITDAQLDRYLRARKQNVPAAIEMGMKAEEWQRQWKPKEISPAEISKALPSGCWRFGGFTDDSRPILIIDAGLWRPKDYTVNEYISKYKYYFSPFFIKSPSL